MCLFTCFFVFLKIVQALSTSLSKADVVGDEGAGSGSDYTTLAACVEPIASKDTLI